MHTRDERIPVQRQFTKQLIAVRRSPRVLVTDPVGLSRSGATNMEQQPDDYRTMLRAYAAANADEMLTPITTAVAATALGLGTPEALQKMRSRNKEKGLPVPPGFAFVPGLGWRYRSKLELLLWAHEYHESRWRDPGSEGGAE